MAKEYLLVDGKLVKADTKLVQVPDTENLNDLADENGAYATQSEEVANEIEELIVNGVIDPRPSYTSTEANILSLTENKGIAVATDTGHWYYWNGANYVDSGMLYQSSEDIKQIKEDNRNNEYKFDTNMNLLFDGYQRNLINTFNAIKDSYINSNTGEVSYQPNYYASDFIEVSANTQYASNITEQCAWYDNNKRLITGLTSSNGTVTSPTNAKYFRTSIREDSLYTSIFVKGASIEKQKIKKINDSYYTTTLQVGNGTYGSLKSALADCVNPSETNRYLIEMYTDYDTPVTDEEMADPNFVGLFVPNWVKIKGVGDRRQITIKLSLSETVPEDIRLRISTLNLQQNSELENLTIIGENCRYAVHDDFEGITDVERHITNCKIISRNTVSHVAWGSGYRSGLKWFFENCVFENEETQGVPFASHNNRGFEQPATLIFTNCRFLGGENNGCARFGSINTGYTNIVNQLIFYGNKINKIYLTEADASTYGKGIKVTVSGCSNTCNNNDVIILNTDDKNYSDYVDLI